MKVTNKKGEDITRYTIQLAEKKITQKEFEELTGLTKKRKCTYCGKAANKQTYKGGENEKSGGLPINDGWFCEKCYEEGAELEREAIYG